MCLQRIQDKEAIVPNPPPRQKTVWRLHETCQVEVQSPQDGSPTQKIRIRCRCQSPNFHCTCAPLLHDWTPFNKRFLVANFQDLTFSRAGTRDGSTRVWGPAPPNPMERVARGSTTKLEVVPTLRKFPEQIFSSSTKSNSLELQEGPLKATPDSGLGGGATMAPEIQGHFKI